MTSDTVGLAERRNLAAELRAIRGNVDAFNPDVRMAARSAFDAAEQVWKLVPKIIEALEAETPNPPLTRSAAE